MKVFVDANVLFSAAYDLKSRSAAVLLVGASKGLLLVTCGYAAEEASRNLQRKAPGALERFPTILKTCASVPTVVQGAAPAGLPSKDHPIWLSARAAACEVLLTGDRKDFGKLAKGPGLRVLSPRELFEEIFG